MNGQYLDIGGRRTYVPPFLNERFGQPPYWACTFTSLLNGANVAYLGGLPASVAEIRALAKASGDIDTSGGSRSSHMVTAMKVRYNRTVQIESLSPARVKERLANGWAMVAGVTYGALPEVYRRPSPRFKGGHRIVLLGWDDGRTRLLDPMQNRDQTFAGQWIQWSEFEPAWWSRDQLWFREGAALAVPRKTVVASFPGGRRWTVGAGTLVRGLSSADPREVLLPRVIGKTSTASFDQVVDVFPAQDGAPRIGRYIHVADGLFKGMLVDPAAKGVVADTGSVPAGAPPAGGGMPATAAATAPATDAIRKAEYDRLKAKFEASDKTAFPSF